MNLAFEQYTFYGFKNKNGHHYVCNTEKIPRYVEII